MGAFGYCVCEHPFPAPDFEEAMMGYRFCPECGQRDIIDDFHRRVAAQQMQDKVETLTKIVKVLAAKIKKIEETQHGTG